MFKRQAHVHTKLAAAIVSALFLSLSAHAGLLGAGGIATGVTSSVVGGMNGRLGVGSPMPVMNTTTLNAASSSAARVNAAVMPAAAANAAAATQVTGQTQAQGAFSTPTAAASTQQAGAAVAGQVTSRETAVVTSGEDITQQAERLTRKGRTTGAIVVEQATDAQGQASGQAIRIKQSGEANAQAQVTAVTSASNAASSTARNGVTSTASRKPQVSAKGAVSDSGSLQASSRNASLSGDASVRGTASVNN